MKKFIQRSVTLLSLCCSVSVLQAQYCIPSYQNPCAGTASYINKYTFNTISNNSSGCNGNAQNYILYPAVGNTTTTVQLGGAYNFSIKSGSGAGSDQGFAIWVDFNNDEDFADGDEFVYGSPYTGNGLFSGIISIPNKLSYIGERRLRVRSALQTLIYAGDVCDTFSNGETEDYTITINPAPPCTGTPDGGTVKAFPSAVCAAGETADLELFSYTIASGLQLQWEESADGNTWVSIPGATNDIFITEPLVSNTYFRVNITCVNSNQSDPSTAALISVGEVEINSITEDTICGPGTAHLQATGIADQIFWFDAPVGGIPIYNSTPPSAFTPDIDSTETFYASAVAGIVYIDSVGLLDSSDASGTDAYKNGFMIFDVFHPCVLAGVYVYPGASGNIYLQLRDQFFTTLKSDTIYIPPPQVNQRVFIELNLELENGDGYQLFLSDESIPLWSTQSNVAYPYAIPGVISINSSNLGPAYYFYFYNWIINYSELCESERVPVTAVVTEAPPLSISVLPSNGTICSNSTDSVQLIASPGFLSYTWQPADGLSSENGNSVFSLPASTTIYTVEASDNICQNEASTTVTVANTPSVTVTSTSDSICGGTSTQLTATATPLLNYAVDQISFQPDTSQGTQVVLDDDEVSGFLPIGFNFIFYGKNYSEFRIASNGLITFDSLADNGCCTGQQIPGTALPNNFIAFAWEDLSPNHGGRIGYLTEGISPNRKLIVKFDSLPHYVVSGPDDSVTSQIILYESSNIIEIHTTCMPGNPHGNWAPHTQGIEDANGTLGTAVPGRNASSSWTAFNDAWRFTPSGYEYAWQPALSLSDTMIANPVATPNGTTVYTVTVTDTATQCSLSKNIKIHVISIPNPGTIDPAFEALCGSDSVQLTLSGYTGGATIQWQQSPTPGGPYTNIAGASQATYQSPLLDTTTYFIALVTCTNDSATDESVVEVLSIPSPPVANEVYRCSPGKVDLSAQGSGGSLSWFDDDSAGNYLGSGTTFTTPFINQSSTFWVSEGPPVASPLSTTFIGGDNSDGNMFDITAIKNIVVTGFDIHLNNNNADVEIYYRKGSSVGYENDANAWLLLGVVNNVQGQGPGIPTPIPFATSVVIPGGYTYGFYITTKNETMNYSYGTAIGNVYAEDSNIQIKENAALNYLFGNVFAPVQWNGVVHYSAIGCNSERTPVDALIYYPEITATSSDSVVCSGDTIALMAVNNSFGTFTYQWYPLLPVMIPADGIGDTIFTSPVFPTLFTLIATEQNIQCDTIIEVNVNVNPTPHASFSGLPDTMLITDSPVLLSGDPAGGTFTGSGINGSMFNPSLAGAGGPYPITYSYTNIYGCSDDTTMYVVVDVADEIISNNDQLHVQVFPNPSNGQFNVILKNGILQGPARLVVYDVYGNKMLSKEIGSPSSENDQYVDASAWEKGTYLLNVLTKNSFFSAKIIVQ